MKKKFSKLFAVFLSILVLCSSFSAFALTEGNSYSYSQKYLDMYYDTGSWETANGHVHDNYGQIALRNLKSTGEPLYCIQIYEACDGSAATAEKIQDTTLWDRELTSVARSVMTRVSIYGSPNYKYGYSATEAQLATQILLWEAEIGARTNYNASLTSFAKNISSTSDSAKKTLDNALDCYLEILEACQNHSYRPDFGETTVELKGAGESNAVTVKDQNGALSNFKVSSSNSNIKVSQSGNNLKIWSTDTGDITATLTLTKKNTDINSAFALTGANQILFYGTIADPVTTRLTVKMSLGQLKIVKVSEDKQVSNVEFKITGPDDYSSTVKTGSNGTVTIPDLNAGTYKVTEVADEKYVQPEALSVKVTAGETATVSFSNKLKKFRVTVTKSDVETTTPQGNAMLSGAVYGIYNNGELVDKYTTDKNGQFTTDYYVCGSNWTIKEISSSEGYLLDTTVYKVGSEAKLYTVEKNTTKNSVKEQVIKGNISIIKHTDDGSTQIETPEKGAEFQIYLKSAGSFANAKDSEKDTIVCDEDGFASSKLLPFGVYTVHQSKGWDGREKIKDFDVFIQSNHQTYKFLINNANFSSYLKVVKSDKETGKTIAYEGAGFEIYDSDGHRVSMQFTYPEVTEVHTFYTNSEGYLITPEKLPYGDYTLVEVQAPFGYILDSTPIPFTINQENSSTDTGVTVVMVKAVDVPQKGTIEISKTGDVFVSVSEDEDNGIYTPVYKPQDLANTVFQIYAAEDIITLDGTVRAHKGEVVDKIITDENGKAISKELYLGKYTVIEKTASDGFYNPNEQYNVELAYAGQDVSITSTELSLYNERQKVTVSLSKVLEQNEDYGIGMNGEIKNVQFGIYADEDITAADGAVIPKDALITYANCDEDGKITFDCDLPIGYKWYAKEIATDEHYILSDTKYEFTTEYQGQEVQTIDIVLNDGKPIENVLKKGVVKGLKVDENGKPLSGAVIGIFAPDTTEFSKENALMTATSAEDGSFSFSNVPCGEWIIREIEAPEGYILCDKEFKIKISDNNEIVEVTIENKKVETPAPVIPETKSPKTGADEYILPVAVTLTAAGLGLLLQQNLKKKRIKNVSRCR